MNYEKLTLEELILLQEDAHDRIQENSFDSKAILRYNELLKLIEERRNRAQYLL